MRAGPARGDSSAGGSNAGGPGGHSLRSRTCRWTPSSSLIVVMAARTSNESPRFPPGLSCPHWMVSAASWIPGFQQTPFPAWSPRLLVTRSSSCAPHITPSWYLRQSFIHQHAPSTYHMPSFGLKDTDLRSILDRHGPGASSTYM